MGISNGKLLAKSISTMIYSWGGGPYPEVFWTYTELVKFINAECGTKFEYLVGEEIDDDNDQRVNELIDYLESDVCNDLPDTHDG